MFRALLNLKTFSSSSFGQSAEVGTFPVLHRLLSRLEALEANKNPINLPFDFLTPFQSRGARMGQLFLSAIQCI